VRVCPSLSMWFCADGEVAIPVTAGADSAAASGKKAPKPNHSNRVWRMQRGELKILAPAFLAATVNGTLFPLFGIVFSRMMEVIFSNRSDAEKQSLYYMALFFGIGLLQFICQLAQPYFFTYAGEKL
jgi:ATP-binding cassette subfamily B (MDR/TAP) protein 1